MKWNSSSEMEQYIVTVAKLLKHFNVDTTTAVRSALHTLGDTTVLSDAYRMYDINEDDYVAYIIKKVI